MTGLLLGNLRGTPAHANNYLPATHLNLAAARYDQKAAKLSHAAGSSVIWYFASWIGVSDPLIRLGDNHMVAQEGCQNQMHISGFM